MLFPEQSYNRHRERTDQVETVAWSYLHTVFNGTTSDPWASTASTLGSSAVNSRSITMDDVTTPNYHKLQQQGRIINNPMEFESVLFCKGIADYYASFINRDGTSPNYYYTGNRDIGTLLVGSPTWNYGPEPSIDNDIIDEAVLEAWSRVSLNEAEILTQLAEAEKTIFSIIDILRRALKILRALVTLKWKVLIRELSPKELANRYMEARYALRPLMYDCIGNMNALRKETAKYHERRTFRAFKSDFSYVDQTDQLLHGYGWFNLYGDLHVSRSLEVRSGVLTLIEGISALDKWGFREPLKTAWEIIPMSFIVDWFFNVGTWINAWTPKWGFRHLASWVAVTDATIHVATAKRCAEYGTTNYESILTIEGSYSKEKIIKYRLPHPHRQTLPSFTGLLNKLDGYKLLDLGIILRQYSSILRGKLRI